MNVETPEFLFSLQYMMANNGDEGAETKPLQLEVKKHSAFWLRHLRMLPTAYTSGDVQR